jgi:HNH endonuclease
MSLSPKPKMCPYCGTIVKELTKDHIVSRSLFVQPYPDNLPTVRVCYPCNQEKGLNEDYLRDFLNEIYT